MTFIVNHFTTSYGKTARNLLNEATQPSEAGARAALETFYYAFNQHSIETLTHIWLNCPLVQLNNPVGGMLRGYEPIRDLYSKLFTGSLNVWVEFEDIVEYFSGKTAIFAGEERGEFTTKDRIIPLRFRTSRCFQYSENDGGWRQIHHHGSIDNVKLLEAYQLAVNDKVVA
ncbi:MAG: YybH family protein [Nostoc sp.]